MKDFAKKDRLLLLERRTFIDALLSCAVCFVIAFVIGVSFAIGVPEARHSQSVASATASK